jgi:hypothetical protein
MLKRITPTAPLKYLLQMHLNQDQRRAKSCILLEQKSWVANHTVIRWLRGWFPAMSLRAYSAMAEASTAYTCFAPACAAPGYMADKFPRNQTKRIAHSMLLQWEVRPSTISIFGAGKRILIIYRISQHLQWHMVNETPKPWLVLTNGVNSTHTCIVLKQNFWKLIILEPCLPDWETRNSRKPELAWAAKSDRMPLPAPTSTTTLPWKSTWFSITAA